MTTTTFPTDVVQAICRHMNDDHPDDALLISRTLGGVADAVSAQTIGVDGASMHFLVHRPAGDPMRVSVPFDEPVSERPQVRLAVVRLYERACAAAGVVPRIH